METLGPFKGIYRVILGLYRGYMSYSLNSLKGGYIGNIPPIMENRMEKNMENEMETGIIG